MRKLLFASVATAALTMGGTAIGTAAFAQESAPRLPVPAVSADSAPTAFLQDAQRAISAHRTGEAEEALERAETRLLDQQGAGAATQPAVQDVAQAREALGKGDTTQAGKDITEALAAPAQMSPAPAAMSAPAATAASAAAGGTSSIGAASPMGVQESQMVDGIPGASYGGVSSVAPDGSSQTYTYGPSN